MNNRYFMKRLMSYTKKLCDIANAEPYDPDAYNAVLRDCNELAAVVNCSHRRRKILVTILKIVCLLLWLCLALIVYSLFF